MWSWRADIDHIDEQRRECLFLRRALKFTLNWREMHKKKNIRSDLPESLTMFLQVISVPFKTQSPLLVSLFSIFLFIS